MNNDSITVIKQNGKQQAYSSDKIERSIKNSCLAVNSTIGEAEKYAELINQKLDKWLKTKNEITTEDLRIKSSNELARYHPEAAYFYANYKKTI